MSIIRLLGKPGKNQEPVRYTLSMEAIFYLCKLYFIYVSYTLLDGSQTLLYGSYNLLDGS